MNAATAEQKQRLAKLARTTLGTLYQLAGGYRTKGKVHASPELARRIEIATHKMFRDTTNIPDYITRSELAPVCARCEYAKRCEGRK